MPLLCEMGLDPGLDHMSAAAMIARVHAEGGAVSSFSSVCGGLPAPECAFAGASPFGYKFSWSPAGVLAATRNDAQWLERGGVVKVDATELLRSARPLPAASKLARAFALEVLPNRDALPYASLYGIDGEAHSFFRGTLRYGGWSELMDGLATLGLTAPDAPLPTGVSTWPQLLAHLGVPRAADAAADGAALARAAEALHWLGAWDGGDGEGDKGGGEHRLSGATVADAFCALLQARLGYGAGERDAVLMEHTVAVAFDDGRAPQTLSASLVGFGDAEGTAGGASAMSKSVGLTAAVGVQRVLAAGLPRLAGVVRPTERSVWEFCLPTLEEEGMRFQESVEYDRAAVEAPAQAQAQAQAHA